MDTPISMKQMLARFADFDAVLVPWEDAAGYGLRRFSMEQPEMRHIALVVGPEGGMSPEEVHAMEAVGARQVTLGPRILRTETGGHCRHGGAAGALWRNGISRRMREELADGCFSHAGM